MTFCLVERTGNLEKPGNRRSLDLREGREEREKSCSCDDHMVPLEFSAGLHLRPSSGIPETCRFHNFFCKAKSSFSALLSVV